MREKFVYILKGFILGISNIIPGVSGGTMAISMGIYDKLLSAISNIFKKFKENLLFLCLIGLGCIIAILSMSKVINISLEKYPMQTMIFFIGLILGGINIITN